MLRVQGDCSQVEYLNYKSFSKNSNRSLKVVTSCTLLFVAILRYQKLLSDEKIFLLLPPTSGFVLAHNSDAKIVDFSLSD
jgi:hypothetical protein